MFTEQFRLSALKANSVQLFVEVAECKPVRPEGFEPLPQNTGLMQKCEQGGTESGTVVEDSRLVRMLRALTSLTDDERELLAELLKKMG